jgi:DNA polymerase-3 subunit alpha
MQQEKNGENIQISFAKIVKIKQIGNRKTYDLEMSEKRRNYVAQGMVVHNSHASAYGLIAYLTAWLKKNYTSEFFTALLSNNIGSDDKMNAYIVECKKLGIKFTKPKINYSIDTFQKTKKGRIRFPLNSIKGIGGKAIEAILNEKEKGKFKSFTDFNERVAKRVVNVGVMEKLIFADAFKEFGKIKEIYTQFNSIKKLKHNRIGYCPECKRSYPLFSAKTHCPNAQCNTELEKYEPTDDDIYKFDINHIASTLYGFTNFFNNKLLNKVEKKMKDYHGIPYNEISNYEGDKIRTVGIVSKMRTHTDKNGNEMAFLEITDTLNTLNVICFSTVWKHNQKYISKGNMYFIKGKVSDGKILLENTLIEKL